MKKYIQQAVFIAATIISLPFAAQTTTVVTSAFGLFDTVYDRFGNQFQLNQLHLKSKKQIGSGNSVNATPSQTCGAGYFTLYYAPGSFIAGNQAAQNTLCQLFTDISNFVNSPLIPNGNKVNILCYDTPPGVTAAGLASGFITVPAGGTNPNPGMIDNQAYKTIVSGIDAYSNLPVSIFGGAGNFYHGYLQINPSAPWDLTYTTTTIPSNTIDFYSLMLHEAMHLLGVYSLIDGNGNSTLGSSNNYYSRYDRFLTNSAFVPLLTSTTGCSYSGLTFTGSATQVNPSNCTNTNTPADQTSCGSAVQYASGTQTVAVYTPTCYEPGSSLSHFEDICTHPTGTTSCTGSPANWNNLYFVVSNQNNTGSCYIKRYPKEEERQVLCDLGYSVSATYAGFSGSPSAMINGTASAYNYSGGACTGPGIWGLNDGIGSGVFTFTAASSSTNALSIPITASITNNDAATTTQISCLEVVYGNATVSMSGGNLIVTTAVGYSGLVLIKYFPDDGNGNYGSPTYIFVYFLPSACAQLNACDLVQNGGFESNNSSVMCGPIVPNQQPGYPDPTCWQAHEGSPDYFVRSCSMVPNYYNLGTSTYFLVPPADSYNGSPNNAVIGMFGDINNVGSFTESVKTVLSASLIPNQPYQADMWILNPSAKVGPANFSVAPIVVSLNSLPNFAFFGTPNLLTNFTVNPTGVWTHVTQTFTPVSSDDVVQVVLNSQASAAINPTITTYSWLYYFIDEVSIKPLPTPTFAIPNASLCGNTTFTDLAQYASPIPGIFTGLGVSATTGTLTQYDFNLSGTLSPGSYPVAFNYTTTSGCAQTIWENIIVAPSVSLSITGLTTVCTVTPANTTTLAASSSCTNCSNYFYYWQPGYIPGPSPALTAGTYTAYVVSGSCTASQTVAITSITSCCTTTISSYVNPVLPSLLTGPRAVNVDVSIPSGSTAVLSGEFLFAPNVKITVNNGSVLRIKDAHLYSCGTMWKGIEVLDGGRVVSIRETNTDNLIEDAITAIDIKSQPTSTLASILEASNTTFNKNYIAINISSFSRIVNPSPFLIDNCVFTCRDLPYTSTAWPQTGTVSASSNTAGDLRYVNTGATPTTGIVPPFLNQSTFTITNLKSPYTNQPSHIAIQLNTVGVISTGTTGAYDIVIGSAGAANFNLFDAHGQFIAANNSNLRLINNVFQNTQTYPLTNGMSKTVFGGAAVAHRTSGTQNTELMMLAPNPDEGNRFWNCHRGIEGKDIFRFWIENAIFRSNQSTATLSFSPTGIQINTNRFEYYMSKNEFFNLGKGINIPLASGNYTIPAGYPIPPMLGYNPGIFADRLRITDNTFIGYTGGTEYMSDAITITGANAIYWYGSVDATQYPTPKAVAITGNTLHGVYRGINVSGVSAFPTFIERNFVELKDNGSLQYGIKVTNSTPATFGYVGGYQYGKTTIAVNTTSFTAAPSNTNSALIFAGHNGYTSNSPSVTCNNLAQSTQGFVFDGPQLSTLWMGNEMKPLGKGLVLSNNGKIGTQGAATFASANLWDGSWGVSNNHTYVDATSNASTSVLYVLNSAGFIPVNNPGFIAAYSYAQPGNINVVSAGAAGYNCAGIPNAKPIPLPNNDEDFLSKELFYIEQMSYYNYVAGDNDSLRSNCAVCDNFYNTYKDSSIGKLSDIELLLYQHNYTDARTILSDLGAAGNAVEVNYKTYYTLYANYLEHDTLSISEKDQLYALAMLCPGKNGKVVYQARALYNYLYMEILNPDCGEGTESAKLASKQQLQNKGSNLWQVQVFPNPAKDRLSIKTNKENEKLHLLVRDLSGRIVLDRYVEVKAFIANLEMELINGAYLIYISNGNETLVKKLHIAK